MSNDKDYEARIHKDPPRSPGLSRGVSREYHEQALTAANTRIAELEASNADLKNKRGHAESEVRDMAEELVALRRKVESVHRVVDTCYANSVASFRAMVARALGVEL